MISKWMKAVIYTVCAVGVVLNVEPGQAADALRPTSSNLELMADQKLVSENGKYSLICQADGNFVLYGPRGSMWATHTVGSGANVCAMQTDGNLVLYAQGQPVWSSNTVGNPGSFLIVQNDGNVVIYSSNGQPVWTTNTVQTVSPVVSPSAPSDVSRSFPLRGSQFTELGDHRRMETNITISNNGRIDGVTHIWTANKWSGFTGAVAVVITDSSGNVLHVTPPQSYGVNCVRCPGPDDRTQQWSDTVPSNILNRVGGYAIVHTTNPRNRWREWLATAGEAVTEIKATYRKF